jgi:hypothetical protein
MGRTIAHPGEKANSREQRLQAVIPDVISSPIMICMVGKLGFHGVRVLITFDTGMNRRIADDQG